MIKAILLDVDGIIVGDQRGVNAPFPHHTVINALKNARAKGILICLCTARPPFAVQKIVEDARLDNPHCTEAGAMVANPLTNSIIKKYVISTALAKKVIHHYISRGVYTELFTQSGFLVDRSQVSSFTENHRFILQSNPRIVDSLAEHASSEDTIKIVVIGDSKLEAEHIERLFEEFKELLTLDWTMHPLLKDMQFGIITPIDVSKKNGAIDISHALHIPLQDMLGIGDTMMDWEFMNICGYCATLEQADENLKRLVALKGERGYIGPHVNENGIIDVLRHFLE